MKTADVCLIIEGGYPYVQGGVSSWVHSLIRSLPQLRFHIVNIRCAAHGTKLKYELPSNVELLEDVVLDGTTFGAPAWRRSSPRKIYDCYRALLSGTDASVIGPLLREIGETKLGCKTLLDSREAWLEMEAHYEALDAAVPLLDFFWTWRTILRSLINIAAAPLPPARLYHAVSTGYAGLYGVRAKMESERPLLLTEHGIYTNERRIEICSADWVYESGVSGYCVGDRRIELRDLWVNAFAGMSKVTYDESDAIVALYTANQLSQIQDGASSNKLRLIPNGVDFNRFSACTPDISAARRPTILLVARVVPIKDVRTFILAVEILAQVVPDIEAIIAGPEEEDPEYAFECHSLVRKSGLDGVVTFKGHVADVRECFQRADVLALTSISEAQPLSVLEAGAAGLPSVTTDVGSCREIMGLDGDETGLGPGGFVVPPGDPRAFATAAAKLLNDPELRKNMGDAMRERVRQLYDQARIWRLYENLYEEHFDRATAPSLECEGS